MPRRTRQKSVTGVYHVIIRGINKQAIIHDKDDRRKFLYILAQIKIGTPFMLYGFCLMDNHVHLLIHEIDDNCSNCGMSYSIDYDNKKKECNEKWIPKNKNEED